MVDLIIIYPKPYSIYLLGTIGFRARGCPLVVYCRADGNQNHKTSLGHPELHSLQKPAETISWWFPKSNYRVPIKYQQQSRRSI